MGLELTVPPPDSLPSKANVPKGAKPGLAAPPFHPHSWFKHLLFGEGLTGHSQGDEGSVAKGMQGWGSHRKTHQLDVLPLHSAWGDCCYLVHVLLLSLVPDSGMGSLSGAPSLVWGDPFPTSSSPARAGNGAPQ